MSKKLWNSILKKTLQQPNSKSIKGSGKMSIIYTRPEVIPVDVSQYDPLLVTLLSKCTPHKHEHHIVEIIKKHIKEPIIEEIEGNLLIKIGDNPTSMFSCHMDIIGNNSKNNEDIGKVDTIILMTPKDTKKYLAGMLYGAKYYINENKEFVRWGPCPLGADDKVGVYILIKMILANIPGLYVFHVGEELGGVGSKYLVDNNKEKFEGYKRAIAFDRAGYGDVIEYQRGGRCCSNIFGKALAAALNNNMPQYQRYKDGITGSFTDTANYRDIIPECTNISVGYFNQHGANEYFDYVWVQHMLLPAILDIDYEKLPTERDPKAVTTYSHSSSRTTYVYSANKKSWKDADKSTSDWDLPIWLPPMGYMEHNDDVLARSIGRFLNQNIYTNKERSNLSEFIFDMLEKYEYATIEIEMHKDMITRLQQTLREGTIEVKEDPDIILKREFLLDLICISDLYDLPQHDDIYKKYCKGATALLNRTEGWLSPDQYSKKDARKLNRTIFMMAYILSISDLINNDVEKLLNKVHNYVTLHLTEEGFNTEPSPIDKKLIEPTNYPHSPEKDNVIPLDTGRSAAVH